MIFGKIFDTGYPTRSQQNIAWMNFEGWPVRILVCMGIIGKPAKIDGHLDWENAGHEWVQN